MPLIILLFGSASYLVAILQMIKGSYRPNVFSRVIWLLLAINSMAGVIYSQGSHASYLLAAVSLIGSLLICLGSFWRGSGAMRKLEYSCLGLFLLSVAIWVLYPIPVVNLCIGLGAHFIGAIPSFRQVYLNGKSESTAFWSLFFIASLTSVISSLGSPLSALIYPLYFTIFDGSMMVLSLRPPRLQRPLNP